MRARLALATAEEEQTVLQLVLLMVLAYVAYRYTGWPGATAVVVVAIALTIWQRYASAAANRRAAVQVVGTPLSDAEKLQVATMRERDQRMAQREAGKSKYGRG